MKSKSILLSIDVVGQLVLLIILGGVTLVSILSAGATTIFIGFALLILGCWQMLSGLIMGIMRNDGKRFEYFLGSAVYLSVLVAGTYVFQGWDIPKFLAIFLMVLGYLVIPSGIAIWYFQYSQTDLAKLRREEKNQILAHSEMDHILDSEEILKHERS